MQLGGGGMNGTIPGLAGPAIDTGLRHLWKRFRSSDGGFRRTRWRARRFLAPGGARKADPARLPREVRWSRRARGPAGPNPNDDWGLNDEAIKNLGYMQMKKTHDAAMVLVERMYGAKPKYNYYVGSSQGGREALTVAQRYPCRL